MTGKRGFTLLEMIVATLIMAIAVVGLLSGIAGATRSASRLRDYGRVTQLARLQMNELMVDFSGGSARSGEFDRAETGYLQAGWRAQITPFELPPAPAPGQLALDRIQLEVWWMAGDQRRTFSLEGFRTRILGAQP